MAASQPVASLEGGKAVVDLLPLANVVLGKNTIVGITMDLSESRTIRQDCSKLKVNLIQVTLDVIWIIRCHIFVLFVMADVWQLAGELIVISRLHQE